MRKWMLMMVAGVMMMGMTACGTTDTVKDNNSNSDIVVEEKVGASTDEQSTDGAYAFANKTWQYHDEDSGKNVHINITPKDEKTALIIVSENAGAGRMWTFNSCVYDEATNTFTADTSEFVATVADEEGNMSVFETNNTVFTISGDTCTWSDAESIFGENVEFMLLFQ